MVRPAPYTAHVRGYFIIALVSLAACAETCSIVRPMNEGAAHPPAAPFMRSDDGSALILRGINLSSESKWTGHRLPPYGEEDFALMHDALGFNAIRLLVFWEAIEPSPGLYDESYLDRIRWLAKAASDAGLYVIVDLHQDLYGSGFGSPGAPTWSCSDFAYESFDTSGPWFMAYLEPEVMHCFDELFRKPEKRHALAAAWRVLVSRVRDVKGVLFYDLFNEPLPGRGGPVEFSEGHGKETFELLIDVVRDEDPGRPIAVAPPPAANFGAPTEMHVQRSGLVYAPHLYSGDLELGLDYDGDRVAVLSQVAQAVRDSHRMQAPLVFGEVGVRRDVWGSTVYAQDLYDVLDELMASALYWDLGRSSAGGYGLLDAEGYLTEIGRAVTRPYPTRVAGTPTSFDWNPQTGSFRLTFSEDVGPPGPTEVALPTLLFPFGVQVSVDGQAPTCAMGPRLEIARRTPTSEVATLRTVAVQMATPGQCVKGAHGEPARAEHAKTTPPAVLPAP